MAVHAGESQEKLILDLYTERNMLVAYVARLTWILGGHAWIGEDESEPDWPVVYIETPQGQLSWHLHKDELPLFAELPRGGPKWDGHDSETKLARLRRILLDED